MCVVSTFVSLLVFVSVYVEMTMCRKINGFDEIGFILVASQVIIDIEECGHSSNNSRSSM